MTSSFYAAARRPVLRAAASRPFADAVDPAGDGTLRVRRFRRGVLSFYRNHHRNFPWRESADPYAVLVGEVLLQRTRAEHAPAVFRRFLCRWPDANALAAAAPSEIEAVIGTLGLRKRAVMLQRLGESLAEMADVPLEPDRLMSLPGVGPYTAHAVPIFARNRSLPLVDWVISRVLCRYFGLAEGRRPNSDPELWALAATIAKPGRAREVWFGTLDLAACVCKKRPLCDRCPLNPGCEYASDGDGLA